MKKLIILLSLFFFIFNLSYSQVVNGVFKCKDDTYNLLKEISESVCSKGEILLSITTHQDLGWVDEVEKCIILQGYSLADSIPEKA